MRKRQGFTLIELLVVMAIIALLLGLLLPALAKARATARQVKDGTQLNQIYKGWLVWAVDNNEDSLPCPGLVNRVGANPGRGKEDLRQNTHDNMHAACITAEYYNPNILVSPSEASGFVIANPIYDIERFSPAQDVYWDDGVGEFLDGFGAGIKIWVWRKQQGAGLEEEFHVLHVYEAERGFARAEDEFLVFLEHHIGGAEQGVFAVAVGNAAEGTHGAG